MYFDVQVGDTHRRLESIANHGLQRFTLSFNRTAVTLNMNSRNQVVVFLDELYLS